MQPTENLPEGATPDDVPLPLYDNTPACACDEYAGWWTVWEW